MTAPVADRIDVLDERGRSIGWVDPRSGVRNLIDDGPCRGVRRDGRLLAVDVGGRVAGLDHGHAPPSTCRCTEIRYPDPPVIRSLLIPLRPLG